MVRNYLLGKQKVLEVLKGLEGKELGLVGDSKRVCWDGVKAKEDRFFVVVECEELARWVGMNYEKLEGVSAHIYGCKERRGWW